MVNNDDDDFIIVIIIIYSAYMFKAVGVSSAWCLCGMHPGNCNATEAMADETTLKKQVAITSTQTTYNLYPRRSVTCHRVLKIPDNQALPLT